MKCLCAFGLALLFACALLFSSGCGSGVTPPAADRLSATAVAPWRVFSPVTKGHAPVNAVAVTPQGTEAVSASTDKTLKVWDLNTGTCLRTLTGHTGPVNAVAVTPDGKYAVSGSADYTLKVWSLSTGRCLKTLTEGSPVKGVAVTPDGAKAVSASADCTLKVWNLSTGACLRTLTDGLPVNTVAVTPDGTEAVAGLSHGGGLQIWNVSTGAILGYCVRYIPGDTYSVLAVAVGPSGTAEAVAGLSDNTLQYWNIQINHPGTAGSLQTLVGDTGPVGAAAVQGTAAVSGSQDGTLKVWNLPRWGAIPPSTAGCLRTIRCPAVPYALAMLPDGAQVVVGGAFGFVGTHGL